MSKSNTMKVLALFILASMILAACGGAGGTPAATEPASGSSSGGGEKKVTSSGYECPEANPKMEVTSTELNLFVWTEYIPQDMQECFELVYGIKVNRDEYSAMKRCTPSSRRGEPPMTWSSPRTTSSVR